MAAFRVAMTKKGQPAGPPLWVWRWRKETQLFCNVKPANLATLWDFGGNRHENGLGSSGALRYR